MGRLDDPQLLVGDLSCTYFSSESWNNSKSLADLDGRVVAGRDDRQLSVDDLSRTYFSSKS